MKQLRRGREAFLVGSGVTLLLATAASGGCAAGGAGGAAGPDLHFVPEEGLLCERDENGRLLFTVRNGGDTRSNGANIRVEYGSGAFPPDNIPHTAGSTFFIACPPFPLDPGQEIVCPAPIPPGCFGPDCSFRVTIDSTDLVDESNEQNNVRGEMCLG